MADEITQAIQLEAEGFKMAFDVAKYGMEGAVKLARLLASFLQYTGGKIHEKFKNRSGERTVKDMMKITDGRVEILQVDENIINELAAFAEKNKLHYAFPLDFNPNDGKTPVMIPADESDLWKSFIAEKVKSLDEENSVLLNTYKKQRDDLVEKKTNLEKKLEVGDVTDRNKTKQEIADLEIQIEQLEKAISDGKNKLNYTVETADVMSYIREAKDTDFENEPELASAVQSRGINYSVGEAKNIFMPIRNEKIVPEGKWCFYVPEQGVKVERQFEIDPDTHLVSSTYTFIDKEGSKWTFTDKDHTDESWIKVRESLFEKAGILEGSMVRVFSSNKDIEAYKSIVEKLKNVDLQKETIENIAKNLRENGATEENISQLYGVASELKKNRNLRNVGENAYSLTFDRQNVTQKEGRIIVDLGDGNKFSFSNVYVPGVTKDGNITFTFDEKCNPCKVLSVDGKDTFNKLSVNEAVTMIANSTKEAIVKPFEKQSSR